MKKFTFFLAALCCMTMAQAKGIPSEIMKDGKAKYIKSTNTLVLEDGFKYSLGKGLVVFETGKDLHILLKGDAEFRAALVFKDNVIIDAEKPSTLSVTSNISGSAIQCPELTINKDARVSLMSRNSQEGMFALSQMVRTTAAIKMLKEKGLPYIVVMTDPTTGGVTASFASLGDILLAETGATIGFAGARVVEQTIRESLPQGFQTAEYLLKHGMLDMVVNRKELRTTLIRIISLLTNTEPSGDIVKLSHS